MSEREGEENQGDKREECAQTTANALGAVAKLETGGAVLPLVLGPRLPRRVAALRCGLDNVQRLSPLGDLVLRRESVGAAPCGFEVAVRDVETGAERIILADRLAVSEGHLSSRGVVARPKLVIWVAVVLFQLPHVFAALRVERENVEGQRLVARIDRCLVVRVVSPLHDLIHAAELLHMTVRPVEAAVVRESTR